MQSITSSDLLQLLSGAQMPATGVAAAPDGGTGVSSQSLKSFLQLFSQQLGTEDITDAADSAIPLLAFPEAQNLQIFSAPVAMGGNSLPQEI